MILKKNTKNNKNKYSKSSKKSSRKSSRNSGKSRKYVKSKHNNSRSHKKYRNKHTKKNMRRMRGGFASNACSLAIVSEPGFSVSSSGSDIPGLNIPESKAMIYDPACKSANLNQAMVP